MTKEQLLTENPELAEELTEVKKLICESCRSGNSCGIYPDRGGCPKLDSVDDLIKCVLKEDAE